MQEEIKSITNVNWKRNALVIGVLAGALVGVAAAYMFIQQRSIDDQPPEISAGDGVKIGVMVLGLLRSIASV